MSNLKNIFFQLVILVMAVIILLQRCGGDGEKPTPPKPRIDTITKYVQVHDTIIGKPRHIYGTIHDTLWITEEDYSPSDRYDSLLKQYESLGGMLFKTNVYETEFPVEDYGVVKVVDSIRANQLIGNHLSFDLKIPQKTIVVKEPAKPTRQIYLGGMLVGSNQSPLTAVYAGGMYKDRKDRLFGVHIGFNGQELLYSVSSYWKLKLKK